MANDSTFIKGFRTNMAYFPESTYGTFAVTDTNAYKVGGNVKSLFSGPDESIPPLL